MKKVKTHAKHFFIKKAKNKKLEILYKRIAIDALKKYLK